MKSVVKQTKIPFSERKLRVRDKFAKPKNVDSSYEEKSPLKYKLVNSSENKITLRRASNSRSDEPVFRSPDRSSRRTDSLRSTPKRRAKKTEENDERVQQPTPSKRKCRTDSGERTPEKQNVAATPSTMLSRLQLSSSKKSKPEGSTPNSKSDMKPKQLFTKSSASSARKALYSSSHSLPCREDQINQLFTILENHLKEQTCGSIYISGLPGTGKTASIDHVMENEKIKKGYHIVKINCTSVSSSTSIYKRISTELKIKTANKSDKDPRTLVEEFLLRRHKMILLILDEIDQLETRTQSVLYKIFEWPSWTKARLVLIGIANAMDLTDRILPRLCAKVELKPVLIHFLPYSKNEIKQILSHRLSEAGADNIFTPSAIELISAKVAGLSGDVRRALDLGRRVVEISEESKAKEKSPSKKIDPVGIDTNVLNDFLKMNECRRSPRKREKQIGDQSEPSSNVENTPVKPLVRSLFATPDRGATASSSPHKRTPQSKKRLFDDDQPQEGGVLKEINQNRSGRENHCSGKRGGTQENVDGGGFGSPMKPAGAVRESPRKQTLRREASADVKSPRKVNFSVDSKDVLNVVKNIYGSSKSLKCNSEDSSFPLHQKILICTFLLISKKGKSKDLSVGKLHQVYTKICTKRGITPVDLSGFLFLCRQVEMTGIMQIGKGPGKLAKVMLQWDEAEVTDALKDLNLLSSIMNDVSCL